MVSGAFVLVWSYAGSILSLLCCSYMCEFVKQIEVDHELADNDRICMHTHAYWMTSAIDRVCMHANSFVSIECDVHANTRTQTELILSAHIASADCVFRIGLHRFGFSLTHRDLFKRLYNVSDFLSQLTKLLKQLTTKNKWKGMLCCCCSVSWSARLSLWVSVTAATCCKYH